MNNELKEILDKYKGWNYKGKCMLFIEKQDDIPVITEYLINQDMDWDNSWANDLIMVLPDLSKSNVSYITLKNLCKYAEKLDIYKLDDFIDTMKSMNINVYPFCAIPEDYD